ncbi:MAG TPA: hypothetical protein VJL31_12980 [Gemmatimonadales bacterium]|nr:hypothetical protein [Gemmatimonadales bacterium]
MPQPPVTPIISRELVRFIPFAAQRTFRSAALANGGTFVAEFDVSLAVTDPNQFLAGAFPGAANPPVAVGPNLDAAWFSDQAGQVVIEYAIDLSCTYRVVNTTIVVANAFGNYSGTRITGRFVRVTFTNNSGVAAVVEFGVYIRST